MSNAAHAYTRPETSNTTALPKLVETYLDGTDLLAKTQALRISTVDADGWPHASLLSAGDMLAMPGGTNPLPHLRSIDDDRAISCAMVALR